MPIARATSKQLGLSAFTASSPVERVISRTLVSKGGVVMSKPIPLPPTAPEGFGWKFDSDTWSWVLAETRPAAIFEIMVGDRFHCGYGDMKTAERFLPFYSEQYPGEIVTIREAVGAEFVDQDA